MTLRTRKPRLKPLSPDELAAHTYRSYSKEHLGMSAAKRRHHHTRVQCMVYSRYDPWLRRFAEKLYTHLNQSHRVYCLSKHYDNLVMWAKYAGIIPATVWNLTGNTSLSILPAM
jgi:hypothetical protein